MGKIKLNGYKLLWIWNYIFGINIKIGFFWYIYWYQNSVFKSFGYYWAGSLLTASSLPRIVWYDWSARIYSRYSWSPGQLGSCEWKFSLECSDKLLKIRQQQVWMFLLTLTMCERNYVWHAFLIDKEKNLQLLRFMFF